MSREVKQVLEYAVPITIWAYGFIFARIIMLLVSG